MERHPLDLLADWREAQLAKDEYSQVTRYRDENYGFELECLVDVLAEQLAALEVPALRALARRMEAQEAALRWYADPVHYEPRPEPTRGWGVRHTVEMSDVIDDEGSRARAALSAAPSGSDTEGETP